MNDRTASPAKKIQQLLPKILDEIGRMQKMRPDLILAAWPEVIGAKLAPMTEAVSFHESVLLVKVKNATLYSLLAKHEKFRLLKNLQEKFPKVEIRNIIFRIG